MVDIETYATHNSRDGKSPQIVQIGACYTIGDGIDMDDTFLVSVADDMDPSYYQDGDTLQWWSRQSMAAKASLHRNLVPGTHDALEKFQFWLDAIGFVQHPGKWSIWANPPSFDLNIIQSARVRESMPRMWHYRQERCCRTLWNEVKAKRKLSMPAGLVKHRADHDAIRQMVGVLERL